MRFLLLVPLQAALETHKVHFTGNLVWDENGTLTEISWDPNALDYVGEPSDELDARWNSLIKGSSPKAM